MKTSFTICFSLVICLSATLHSQEYFQYFDGADTIYDPNVYSGSVRINFNGDSTNIWQIGVPQKVIFNGAATSPNVLVTDTVNYYPNNDSSSFQYTIRPWQTWGILAIQWKQKLDMDYAKDIGMIEFSVDGGNTWASAFDNPYVYNFYGFEEENADTLVAGKKGFTGVDTTWRDIWLCYDMTWLNYNDSIMVRHTFLSDSLDNNNEGWMIDNLLVHITIIHTVSEVEQKEYIKLAPNPTKGRIEISLKKINEPHLIENMELLDASGRVLERWKNIPSKFFIDIANYPNGMYFLNVKTNKKNEMVKVMLQQ